jgi:LacI family transcriptional regulator
VSVTLNDVARQAGVSIKTVSRVVNNQGEVSKETRQRVLLAIQDLGYQPNIFARGLVSQRSYTLAIVSWGLDRYSPSQFVMGVEREADNLGYSLLLTLMRRSRLENIDAFLNSLLARQVDGIIWQAPRVGANLDWIRPERLVNLPPIVLNGLPDPYVTTVSMDNHHGALLATRHLVEQGWKTIALINGRIEHPMATERRRGWQDALLEAGRQPDESMVLHGDWSAESGYRCMKELLERRPDVDAIFAADDRIAFGAIGAAQQAGRAIGRNLGVVGFDGLPESEFFTPPLSTIYQPIFELGRAATRALVQLVEARARGDNPPEKPEWIIMKPELVVRQSSLRAAVPEPLKEISHV